MHQTLDLFERRVLGVLIEKSIATPEYYPMTVNAIVAGCNQKNNRDPVIDLDEDTVWKSLSSLREKGMVRQVMPGPGARIDKYKHECFEHFGWEQRERAVMCELLVRGPQTVGELRTHCSRLMTFDTLESVQIVIDLLMGKAPPLVRTMPRTSGKAVRYAHMFYPPDEDPAAAAPIAFAPPFPSGASPSSAIGPASHGPPAHATAASPAASASSPAAHAPQATAETLALRLQIEALQGQTADLNQRLGDQGRTIEEMGRRIEKLERLMG